MALRAGIRGVSTALVESARLHLKERAAAERLRVLRCVSVGDTAGAAPRPALTSDFALEQLDAKLREASDSTAADDVRARALAIAFEQGDADSSRALCEAVITSLTRERRPDLAWAAFDEARQRGVTPTPGTFASVIQASALSDELERAECALDDMRACGHWPPPAACWDNLLFAHAARAEAFARLSSAERAQLRRQCVEASPASVTEGALSVLRRMAVEGQSASSTTHLGLLRVLASAGQPARAQAVLVALLHARAPVSEAHFACAIDACGVAARLSPGSEATEALLGEALGILDALALALGAPPTARALRAMLRAYATAGRMNRALDWLSKGYATYGVQPTAECYGVAVRMCREIARPDVAAEVLSRARVANLQLGALDGSAAQLQALAARWQLGSVVGRPLDAELHSHVASRSLFVLADEMAHHPALAAAGAEIRKRAELGRRGPDTRSQPAVGGSDEQLADALRLNGAQGAAAV